MSNRTKQLNDSKLVTELTDMKQTMDDLKNQQATSMISGVLGYMNDNDVDWDVEATIGSDSDTLTRTTTVSVYYFGDASQAVAFANPAYTVCTNGTDSAHQLTIPNVDWTDGTRKAHMSNGQVTISGCNYTVVFLLTTLKQVTYHIKAYVAASQRGTVVVTAV